MNNEIFNKVTASGILRLDLRKYITNIEVVSLDVAGLLPEDQIVREQAFIKKLTMIDWKQFSGKAVAVFCSEDAIVPQWVYLQIGVWLAPYAHTVGFASVKQFREQLWESNLSVADLSVFYSNKVAVLAHPDIPDALYLRLAVLLHEKVKSIMYGEPGFPKMIKKY